MTKGNNKLNKVLLLRFGEIFLKGKNRAFFENTLFHNVKKITNTYGATLTKTIGRLVVTNLNEDYMSLVERLKNVFGLVSLSIADEVASNLEAIENICSKIEIQTKTFKVQTKRADKRFPMSSYELSAHIGGVVLDNNPNVAVNVVEPETTINIDIRENGKTYIYYDKIPCVGGLPLGTAGKGLLLLSGGIDSPVAGFLMAKRGLYCEAIHFHSFPYTSQQAKDKVISLAKLMSNFAGKFRLHVVPFTKIQEEIHKHCDSNYMVILVRRFMMKIAERVANNLNAQAIITGENLAQVASQTVESITITNQAVEKLPVLRPLIAYDKVDIMSLAKHIGTYETSILPYEDCCSVFLPDNPVTKPKEDKIQYNESKLDVEGLINQAIDNIETILID